MVKYGRDQHYIVKRLPSNSKQINLKKNVKQNKEKEKVKKNKIDQRKAGTFAPLGQTPPLWGGPLW